MKVSYDELESVVFNTLDFCGDTMKAAREFCKEEGFAWGEREQKLVLRLEQDYKDSVSDELPKVNWG